MASSQEWSVMPSVSAASTGLGARRPSAAAIRRTGASLDAVLGEAIVARAREQQRALIAYDAAADITALSAFEGQCIEIAPLAEPRLRALVDAYALETIQAVRRYGR